jgi:DNA-directed RNA polymerase subunit RPC12/RpoP
MASVVFVCPECGAETAAVSSQVKLGLKCPSCENLVEMRRKHPPVKQSRFRLATRREAITTIGVLLAAIVVVAVVKSFFSRDRLEFNGGEVLYSSIHQKENAARLGRYLVSQGFFDGTKKTVELRDGDRAYEVRFVVKTGIDSDPMYIAVFRELAREIAFRVFGGKAVDVHLCDENLRTLRVIPTN